MAGTQLKRKMGNQHSLAASYKCAMHRVFYIPVRIVYHSYALIADAVDRYKPSNDPPLPAVPCQICGQLRHREKYCPNAKGLGYWPWLTSERSANLQVWDNHAGAQPDRFWQGVTIRFKPCRILENKIESMNEFTFNVLSVRLGKPDLKL